MNGRMKGNSLFVKLLLIFLVIILLVSSFNLLSFSFFKQSIQDEIIKSNRMILNNAADRYSTYFERLKMIMFRYSQDRNADMFNKQLLVRQERDVDYLLVNKTINDMHADVFNPLYFLDNLIFHFQNAEFTFDKEGSSAAKQMFTSIYASDNYSYEFWQKQFDYASSFEILPSAKFYSRSGWIEEKELLPIRLHLPETNVQVIAMVDIEQMRKAFFDKENADRIFMIVDKHGEVLYKSTENTPQLPISAMETDQDYVQQDGYYFFTREDEGGLKYVSVVPNSNISSQVTQIRVYLVLIMALSIGIGLAVSLFFSNRIHMPVKRLITSLKDGKFPIARSNIKEFDLIGGTLQELYQEKDEVAKELQNQRSILTHYSYMNKLRSITDEVHKWEDVVSSEHGYYLVLYSLRFRPNALSEMELSRKKAARVMCSHINQVLSEKFPGSHTFQMERIQILSVIEGNVEAEQILQELEGLKALFDLDKEYCLITIAVSPWFELSSQFHEHYLAMLKRVNQAKLAEETQVLTEDRRAIETFAFSPAQDQELNGLLQAGDEEGSYSFICRTLHEMVEKEQSIAQIRTFTDTVVAKMVKILELSRVEPEAIKYLKVFSDQLGQCCTIEEYKRGFRSFLSSSTAHIRLKKEEDPVITYVMHILQTEYQKDLSLDYLAQKLNMSSAYLSVYIKEKTGENFIDHLNGIRIQRAKEMLAFSQKMINEISVEVGYVNITSFNRMFRKKAGMSPSEYRKTLALITLNES